ncbi:MAG: ABC transporter substrate-binding protein [Eubacteriales bacterium]|nr:ABC transporter substrate-binding protein [Eubacteriales bacterium]
MKTGKKLLAALLCAALAVSAAGCGKDADAGGESAEAQATAAGPEAEEKGNEETQGEGSSTAAMGRYMESEVALPEGAAVYARTMRILNDGTWRYFDGEIGLYASEDEGKSWKRLSSAEELQIEGYINCSALAPDGSLALCQLYFGDDSVSEATVTSLNPAGERMETDGRWTDMDWITRLAFSPDGGLYASSLQGKVCSIDQKTGELKQLFQAAEGPEVLAFSGKLLLALENDRVEIYHLETKALQDADAVLDEFCQENLYGSLGNNSDCVGAYLFTKEEGVLYIACSQGVYRHVLGGNAMEQIIEGSFSSFGDPTLGICSVAMLESGEFLLLTTGTQMIRLTYDPNEPTVPEKQLKVYSLEENSRLRQAISVYQKEYPDVYVSYETGMTEGSAVTQVDALKNLNLELMGGNGPDVIVLDGIDASPYEKKGMLQDLNGILEDIAANDAVFENIAGAFGREEGTFVIPAGFSLPLILTKTGDIDSVNDLETLADLTVRLGEGLTEGTVTGAMTAQQELTQLFSVCSPAWLEDGQLDEEALTEFLTQAKRMYEADQAVVDSGISEIFGDYPGPKTVGSQTAAMMIGLGQIAYGPAETMLIDMGGIGYFLEEGGYSFGLLAGQCEAGFIPVNKLAISAQTKRREEAEAFVRLMLSEQVQDVSMGDCFPVNRASFEKMCEWKDQWVGGTWKLSDGNREYGNGWPNEETIKRMKELVEQADQSLEGNAILEEAVLQYGPQVLTGTISVEEGVQEIKRTVSIYLSEIG